MAGGRTAEAGGFWTMWVVTVQPNSRVPRTLHLFFELQPPQRRQHGGIPKHHEPLMRIRIEDIEFMRILAKGPETPESRQPPGPGGA